MRTEIIVGDAALVTTAFGRIQVTCHNDCSSVAGVCSAVIESNLLAEWD